MTKLISMKDKLKCSTAYQMVMTFLFSVYATLQCILFNTKRKLKENSGAFTEDGIRTVIIVAVGAIIIGLLVALVKGKIFPTIENKVDGFFAMN